MKHLDWYMTMKKTSDKRNAKYYAAWLSWGSEYHPWELIHGCETLHRFFLLLVLTMTLRNILE